MQGTIKAWFRKFKKTNGSAKPKKITDPVCNMRIEPGVFISEHNGKVYCFCSDYCKMQFDADPSQYI